jgi:hypothetical protein
VLLALGLPVSALPLPLLEDMAPPVAQEVQ